MWAQTGLAAVRHANLDLAGLNATNRMTAASPKRLWRETAGLVRADLRGASFECTICGDCVENSTQQNFFQNIGTLSVQIGLHETMCAKAGYREKRFSEFDRSGQDTAFFNTIRT